MAHKFYFILFGIIFFLPSCETNYKDDCPFKELNTQSFSISEVKEGYKNTIRIGLELDPKLLKKLNMGHLSISDTNVLFRELNKKDSIISKISKEKVEKNNLVKNSYCTIWQELKNNADSATRKKLSEMNLKLIQDFNEWIFQDTSDETDNKPYILKSTFIISNFYNDNLRLLIEKKTGITYSSTSTRRISFKNTGEIYPLKENKNLYAYEGGNLVVVINETDCYFFKNITIPSTFSPGNSRTEVEKELHDNIEKAINDNLSQIATKISACLIR